MWSNSQSLINNVASNSIDKTNKGEEECDKHLSTIRSEVTAPHVIDAETNSKEKSYLESVDSNAESKIEEALLINLKEKDLYSKTFQQNVNYKSNECIYTTAESDDSGGKYDNNNPQKGITTKSNHDDDDDDDDDLQNDMLMIIEELEREEHSSERTRQAKAPLRLSEVYSEEAKSKEEHEELCKQSKYNSCFKQIYKYLHPYQREMIKRSVARDSIIQMPTGAGKTLLAVELAARQLYLHPDKRIIFVVNRRHLIDQQLAVFAKFLRCPVAGIKGGCKEYNTPEKFWTSQVPVAVIMDAIFLSWLNLSASGHLSLPKVVSSNYSGACNYLDGHNTSSLQYCKATSPSSTFFSSNNLIDAISLIIFDEVHHATGGNYKQFFDLIHSLAPRAANIKFNCTEECKKLEEQLWRNKFIDGDVYKCHLEELQDKCNDNSETNCLDWQLDENMYKYAHVKYNSQREPDTVEINMIVVEENKLHNNNSEPESRLSNAFATDVDKQIEHHHKNIETLSQTQELNKLTENAINTITNSHDNYDQENKAKLYDSITDSINEDKVIEKECELLLQPLRTMKLPHLLGLTASPITGLKESEMLNELKELLDITKCSLQGVQVRKDNLHHNIRLPQMIGFSYWPHKAELLLRCTIMEIMRVIYLELISEVINGKSHTSSYLANQVVTINYTAMTKKELKKLSSLFAHLDVQMLMSVTFQNICTQLETSWLSSLDSQHAQLHSKRDRTPWTTTSTSTSTSYGNATFNTYASEKQKLFSTSECYQESSSSSSLSTQQLSRSAQSNNALHNLFSIGVNNSNNNNNNDNKHSQLQLSERQRSEHEIEHSSYSSLPQEIISSLKFKIECIRLLRTLSRFVALLITISIDEAFHYFYEIYTSKALVLLQEEARNNKRIRLVVVALVMEIHKIAMECKRQNLFIPGSASHTTSEHAITSPVLPSITHSITPAQPVTLLATRLQLLVRILNEVAHYLQCTPEHLETFRCIIFVEEKAMCHAIYHHLVHYCPLINSVLTPDKLLGRNKSTKIPGMTHAAQREVLARFRSGNVRLLLSTSVAEEGLDVQSCNMVVRYAACPTLVSVIQSRGRARQRHSLFIMFANVFNKETNIAHIRRSVNRHEQILSQQQCKEQSESSAGISANAISSPSVASPLLLADNVSPNTVKDEFIVDDDDDDDDDDNNNSDREDDNSDAEDNMMLNKSDIWLRLPEKMIEWLQTYYKTYIYSTRHQQSLTGAGKVHYTFAARFPLTLSGNELLQQHEQERKHQEWQEQQLQRRQQEEQQRERMSYYTEESYTHSWRQYNSHEQRIFIVGECKSGSKVSRRKAMKAFLLEAKDANLLWPFFSQSTIHPSGGVTATQPNTHESSVFDNKTINKVADTTTTTTTTTIIVNNNSNTIKSESRINYYDEGDRNSIVQDEYVTLVPSAFCFGVNLCACRAGTMSMWRIRKCIPSVQVVKSFVSSEWVRSGNPHALFLHEMHRRKCNTFTIETKRCQGSDINVNADENEIEEVTIDVKLNPLTDTNTLTVDIADNNQYHNIAMIKTKEEVGNAHDVFSSGCSQQEFFINDVNSNNVNSINNNTSELKVTVRSSFPYENACLQMLEKLNVTVLKGVTTNELVNAFERGAADFIAEERF